MTRPPFIISAKDVPEDTGSYPGSSELLSYGRRIGKAAGLLRIGLHIERLQPGQRTSWPHAESDEEEFVYVLEGEVDAWVDGHIHRMQPGDLAAFPAGTGICHCFLNNTDQDVVLLVGGEGNKSHNRCYYPLHPSRRPQMPWSQWWDDIPLKPQGPHDGKPDRLRAAEAEEASKKG